MCFLFIDVQQLVSFFENVVRNTNTEHCGFFLVLLLFFLLLRLLEFRCILIWHLRQTQQQLKVPQLQQQRSPQTQHQHQLQYLVVQQLLQLPLQQPQQSRLQQQRQQQRRQQLVNNIS